MISQYIIILPKVTSLYLLTTAAMISVPPVLPLLLNTMPRPIPQSIEPKIQAIESCPGPRSFNGLPAASTNTNCKNHSKNVSIIIAYADLILNFGPRILAAQLRNMTLTIKYVH